MLKRHPSLTEQVKSVIKQRILNDEFDQGRIPSETDLAEMLGVSRTTVRDALSRLELEGAVTRKQGAGTFVNRAGLRVKSRLEEIWSYDAVLQAHGYTPSVQVLEWRTAAVEDSVADELGLAPGAPVWRMCKLFLQDADPVILTTNVVPAALLTEPVDQEAVKRPLYDFLWQFGRIQLAYYLTEIVPVAADAELSVTLAIPQQTPLISFSEIGYTPDNIPIVKAVSYFRDDLLRLRLLRRNINLS